MNSKRLIVNPVPAERFTTFGEEPLSRLEQIRAKALKLFAERGLAQIGMRELALHLGIAAGSFYDHFESKENLLFDVIEELYEGLPEATLLTEEGSAYYRLKAPLRAHIALHERRTLHFLMVEQEFRCLSLRHREQIPQLRRRYEEKLLQRLVEAGATGSAPVLQATVYGVVSWLNNLATWLDRSDLNPAQRLEEVDAIVLGALSSILKQPKVAADSAAVVPLHVLDAGLQG
jgi:AcrR family transcriptional regulator